MILLCVDGIDPGLVLEYGWGDLFLFNYSLKIPKECYVPDVELGSTPHTTRVWPTIFSGEGKRSSTQSILQMKTWILFSIIMIPFIGTFQQ
jgi:hypothetical protein